MTAATRHKAALLLGPTGSGKTPLGTLLEQRGLWENACRHFDFGAQLRAIVARDRPDARIGRAELDFLCEVLCTGALLEDEHFYLAEQILRGFLDEPASAKAITVLNGLPRHAGQARAIDDLLDVETVIQLVCSPETVVERIRANTGGDRTLREDDDLESVRKKLRIYAERTAPLVDHYRTRGARIASIEVAGTMTPEQTWTALHNRRI